MDLAKGNRPSPPTRPAAGIVARRRLPRRSELDLPAGNAVFQKPAGTVQDHG